MDHNHNEFRLHDPPDDCVSSVAYAQDSRHLLTASWDCSVRLYDTRANQLRARYYHEAPVLDVAFQSNSTFVWSGDADCVLKKYDVENQSETTVGGHYEPIRKVVYMPTMGVVSTGSWDGHMKIWDPRLNECVLDQALPDKVYAMAVCGYQIIVGLAGRLVQIWDIRNMDHFQRSPMLHYQLRCIDSFDQDRGFVVGSVEGRAAVEYLDPSSKGYKFKCHRHKDPMTKVDMIYPVNTISLHPRHSTLFATGGSDGFVCIWDGVNQKRMMQSHKYPTSISSINFSPDGACLAIATSDVHEYENTIMPSKSIRPDNAIYIKTIKDDDVRPRLASRQSRLTHD